MKLSRFLQSPQIIILGSFFVLIAIGTFLLMLPISQKTEVGLIDAIFIATSAVCVTGLVTVNVAETFTHFGHWVILLLMQMGGLGIMTIGAVIFFMLGQKLSFQSEEALNDSLYQAPKRNRIKKDLKSIIKITLSIEVIAIVFFFFLFSEDYGKTYNGFFLSLFHTVSAFCNAGFSLFPESLVTYRNSNYILLISTILILIGSIGYPVIIDLKEKLLFYLDKLKGKKRSYKFLSFHSKIVLHTTFFVIVVGTLILYFDNLINNQGYEKLNILDSLFLSAASRTAGFNTINVGIIPASTLLILIFLMFIGGAPASCAGGMKVTTFATWISTVYSRFKGYKEVYLGNRKLSERTVNKAFLLLSLYITLNIVGFWVLAVTELRNDSPFGLIDILFEQMSAAATVGLSSGITPYLSDFGKSWIIICMYIGRLGPLTLGFLILREKKLKVRYPEEEIMIG